LHQGASRHIRLVTVQMEDAVANKEQKRSSKEAKKPKQNKKGADKGSKRQTSKS